MVQGKLGNLKDAGALVPAEKSGAESAASTTWEVSSKSDASSPAAGSSATAQTGAMVPAVGAVATQGPNGPKALAGHFICKACRKQVPLSQMCASRSGWCRMDSASYKALATRWAKDRSLKTWFQAMTPEQQANWYCRRQTFSSNDGKRRFDDVKYSDVAEDVEGTGEEDQDWFQTWSVFLRNCLIEGKTAQQAESLWTSMIDDPRVECIHRRGQWLVPEWQGVKRAKLSQNLNRSSSSRNATAATPEQLHSLQANGRMLLDQFKEGVLPAPNIVPTQPMTTAQQSDQPVCRAPANVIGAQITREASCKFLVRTTMSDCFVFPKLFSSIG